MSQLIWRMDTRQPVLCRSNISFNGCLDTCVTHIPLFNRAIRAKVLSFAWMISRGWALARARKLHQIVHTRTYEYMCCHQPFVQN